ncbi:hypothetical protein ACOSQ2_027604 [Xanthoceras sorbifolium]
MGVGGSLFTVKTKRTNCIERYFHADKLAVVGSQSCEALHKKFLTFKGTGRPQTDGYHQEITEESEEEG